MLPPRPTGTLQGLRARQDLPGRGVGAVGCPWPGTPAGSAAQASAKEAGHLIAVCQADTTRLPPAWPELPRDPRGVCAGVLEQERVWAKGQGISRRRALFQLHLPQSFLWGRRRPAAHLVALSPCVGTAGTEASGSSQTGPSYSSKPGSPAVERELEACEAQLRGEGILTYWAGSWALH